MMRDFTMDMYSHLLDVLKREKYKMVTMADFIKNKMWEMDGKICVLRHDIDKKIDHAVYMAKIENKKGVIATYYVRFIPQIYSIRLLKEIESYGHEIGYHYETLDKARGNIDEAYKIFKKELEELRKDFKIETICMHGYSLPPWKNLDIWKKKYDYKEFGIVGEPYLDVDYTNVAYFTDTGRSWASKARVKDYVPEGNYNERNNLYPKTTMDLIELIKRKKPEKIIILAHPHRWALSTWDWLTELIGQKIKNVGKLWLKRRRK